MGMDVYGKAPVSEKGEYFRNNIWWWHPLWDYCLSVMPGLAEAVPDGHSNGGDGLKTGIEARQLADVLRAEVESGRTAEYATRRNAYLESLPLELCRICNGTGQRPDGLYGVTWTETGCNGCNDTGKVKNFALSYAFDVENVMEFIEFLNDCGGFEIS